MTTKNKWRKADYANLPNQFSGNGIVSPCGRFYVSTRYVNSTYHALNWAVLDLYTDEFVDNFRFRRDAVAYAEKHFTRTDVNQHA